MTSILPVLKKALGARKNFMAQPHDTAFRLFNGFTEGYPGLVFDLYASTLVIFNLADEPDTLQQTILEGYIYLLDYLPWVTSILLKTHHASSIQEKRGRLLAGSSPDLKVREHDVWYALNLTINQDASFYLDTRNLRKWLIQNTKGRSVLNAFSYTGSLGVAALAGGAKRVVHLDINREFLKLAKASCALNGFPIQRSDFVTADFWSFTNRLRRSAELFDCVILDPPFFFSTNRGRMNLNTDSRHLINKVRPLIKDNGWLVAVNNALFVSGEEYMSELRSLCADGYLGIETLVPVPEDITSFPETRANPSPADPRPFNHSTKIAVLKVHRKKQE